MTGMVQIENVGGAPRATKPAVLATNRPGLRVWNQAQSSLIKVNQGKIKENSRDIAHSDDLGICLLTRFYAFLRDLTFSNEARRYILGLDARRCGRAKLGQGVSPRGIVFGRLAG
jgi:hypothetical protein